MLYLVPDIPHMLKLFRLHCCTKGFLLPVKNTYTVRYAQPNKNNAQFLLDSGDYFPLIRSHFEEILTRDSGEFKIHWKLKKGHLDLEQGNKMNVRLAAQTFSSSTAAAMRFLRYDWHHQAEAVEVPNDVRVP